MKLLFYYVILFIGVRKSFKILTVSETAKGDILRLFKIRSRKVIVTYNFKIGSKISPSSDRENYILYVGNVYPHKNVYRLIKAYIALVSKLAGQGAKVPKLIFVGKYDHFYKKLMKYIPSDMKSKIVFMGFCEEKVLENLYRNSLAVVQPSLYEGFGYQLLEAFSSGTVVVCSDIPVFRELAEDAVIYFDPTNIHSIEDKLFLVSTMSNEDRSYYIEESQKVLLRFNAREEVQKVLEVYKSNNI